MLVVYYNSKYYEYRVGTTVSWGSSRIGSIPSVEEYFKNHAVWR